ncbi:Membrane transporter of cations and cationic drugs [Bibersteinia trehalosi USDA-ARS-USMARC-189]|uniref:Membrane transporter of cations and cationic drugs n=1 Tax=Bibersteinia trehalosi USDA-ARS-USMARC-189 TaxID=1263831 RepID=A0ABM5PFR3_BIBTR|nr:Membrane transporter of cations and cationic drugs [Bibersteinia trehalosi USDA-ARS-USMARC-192]AHG85162.1 Membrane transporter of cations and cationic drugs [Bibersteinia trehalosi USDA-ARS-USMARC-189]
MINAVWGGVGGVWRKGGFLGNGEHWADFGRDDHDEYTVQNGWALEINTA